MAPKWEPPTQVPVTCPCCGATFSVPLKAGGMTEQQISGIMETLRLSHPEIYDELGDETGG